MPVDSKLRVSVGYVWNVNDVLGKGATGMVYAGRDKKTGERVAVKTFSAKDPRPMEVQKREWQVQKSLLHENIVQLLAVEEEMYSRASHMPVLVMELCTGGSLYDVLDDPENHFGLEEDEFKLVLKHIADGMQHLRAKGIIHRDIKPGNILRYVGDDGRSVYKLTDFGAARELRDEEQFKSLYGTEEYLHPELYGRAVVRHVNAARQFGAHVDLWSMGVTFYHAATGRLPFRPYEGIRRDRGMMYEIIVEKKHGVISGVQAEKGGAIRWSKELPPTCRLSSGLRSQVTPILAGIIEADCEKVWSFEKFFAEAKKISDKRVVHVFLVEKFQHHLLYMDASQTISDLEALLRVEFYNSKKDPLFVSFNSAILKPASKLPDTTKIYPVCVFSSSDENDYGKINPMANVNYHRLLEHQGALNQQMLSEDYHEAKDYSSLSYVIQRLVCDFVTAIHVAANSVQSLIVIRNEQAAQNKELSKSLLLLQEQLQSWVEALRSQLTQDIKLVNMVRTNAATDLLEMHNASQHLREIEKEHGQLNDRVTDVCQRVEKMYSAAVSDRTKQFLEGYNSQNSELFANRSKKISSDVREIFEQFRGDKSDEKTLNYAQEQIHKFDRQTLRSRAQDATKLHAEVYSRVARLFQDVQHLVQTHELAELFTTQTELQRLLSECRNLTSKISQASRAIQRDIQEATSNLPGPRAGGIPSPNVSTDDASNQRARGQDTPGELHEFLEAQRREIRMGADSLTSVPFLSSVSFDDIIPDVSSAQRHEA